MFRYYHEITLPDGHKRIVGPGFFEKAVAKSWTPLIKSSWHGLRTRVVEVKSEKKGGA